METDWDCGAEGIAVDGGVVETTVAKTLCEGNTGGTVGSMEEILVSEGKGIMEDAELEGKAVSVGKCSPGEEVSCAGRAKTNPMRVVSIIFEEKVVAVDGSFHVLHHVSSSVTTSICNTPENRLPGGPYRLKYPKEGPANILINARRKTKHILKN